MVVVDKNTKLGHFILIKEIIDSQDTALLYLHHIWKHHGTPYEVISDRGLVFVSGRLLELLRIKPSLTTTFHPQTDGQTKRVNQVHKQYLRIITSRCQDDWADLLTFAKFAYNNASYLAMGFSPFYVTYGYHLALSFMTPTSSMVPAAEDRIRHLQQVHKELKIMIQMVGNRPKLISTRKLRCHQLFTSMIRSFFDMTIFLQMCHQKNYYLGFWDHF